MRDLESEESSGSAENERQVVGSETKEMNASSLKKYVCYMLNGHYISYVWYMHFGQIQFGDHRHENVYLDYSRVVAVPENLVWLTLCLLLAARLRNTTLLTKGGLPPEMDSQVMNCETKDCF